MSDAAVIEPTGDPGLGIGGPQTGGGGPPTPPSEPPAPEPKVEPKAEPPKPTAKAPTSKAAPAPKSVAEEPPASSEPAPVAAPANWPDDWRARLAGDDKAAINRLSRFQSPEDIFKSYLNLEKMLSSGQYAKKLPTHYTEKELEDYRKANGIPDKPEDYDTNIGNGIVWGETDKPMIEDFTQFAHENNMPPEFVKRGLEWYARAQEQLQDRLDEQDHLHYQAGADQLRAEWGGEMKPNMARIKNMFEGHPGVWDRIMGSRDDGGMRGGDDPALLKWALSIANELNPEATVMPSASGGGPTSVTDRMREIEGLMSDHGSVYWRGPQSATLQEEYRKLIDISERQKSRAA